LAKNGLRSIFTLNLKESPISTLDPIDDAVTGTRRARKKERTRREIFRTAMGLFAESGYDGVTIEDICRNASVAKATFFLHFENKAALLKDFNDEVTQSLIEHMAGHDGSAEEQLVQLQAAFRDAWLANAPVMQKMLREFIDQPTALTKAAAVNESIIDLVTQIVQRGQEKGELRSGIAPELAAVSIVSTWSAIAAWRNDHPESADDTASLQIIDITLNGLKKRT
tara:strand:- start:4945 stop:5619 length:675 start_codon:yes stop_codon:yes gene_type:complete